MPLIMIDRLSCSTEANGDDCCWNYRKNDHWMVRFCPPFQFISDQGDLSLQFFSSWLIYVESRWSHTTPYRPQCNGKLERFHRTLKSALKAHQSLNWTGTLPSVFSGLRDDTDCSISQNLREFNAKNVKAIWEKYSSAGRVLHSIKVRGLPSIISFHPQWRSVLYSCFCEDWHSSETSRSTLRRAVNGFATARQRFHFGHQTKTNYHIDWSSKAYLMSSSSERSIKCMPCSSTEPLAPPAQNVTK